MSWQVKPSATTKIEEPDKKYITPAMLKRFKGEIIPRYERKQGALLPILNEIQHHYRCVPYAAMIEVAKLLEITAADVWAAYVSAMKAAERQGSVAETRERVRALVAGETTRDRFVGRILGRELGLA